MKTTHVIVRSLTAASLCCAFVVSGYATGRVNHEGVASIDKPGGDHRAKVVSRLIEVGYSEEEAAARVDEMTDAELVHFAGNPEAVRRSGFIILSSLIGSSVWSTIENKEKKKVTEAERVHLAEAEAKREAEAKADRIDRKIQSAQMDINNKTMLLVNESDPTKKMRLEEQIKILEERITSLRIQSDGI